MFEQIVRGALWVVVATYAVGTFKTLMLAMGAVPGQGSSHVLVVEADQKPRLYPVIDGTDTPMPFARSLRTGYRVVGLSRLYYPVHGETAVRDSRFPSILR